MRGKTFGWAWLLVVGGLVAAGGASGQQYAPPDPVVPIDVGTLSPGQPFTYGEYVMYPVTRPISGETVLSRHAWEVEAPAMVAIAGKARTGKGTRLVRPEGKLRLRCKSRWHNLELTLEANKPRRIEEAGLHALRPPELGEGVTWKVKGRALTALARALHAIEWRVPPTDEAAYAKWKGSMPTRHSFEAGGELTLKLKRDKEGYRAEVAGKVEAVDEGWLASRYGPNGWRHEWSHTLRGSLSLDREGRVLSCKLEDTVRVKGKFHSGTLEDPFTQEGTLKVTIAPPEPLAAGEEGKARELIELLGSEVFLTRERASAELAKMGPKVAPLLRALGLTSKDPEVRRRAEAILRGLP
jgi:hypothetical protein